MPIDYSKWDKIELSDDSDIEVHPNVDKNSFIKWKQRDIHEKRQQRNIEIKSILVQLTMYAKLNTRVDYLLANLSPSQFLDNDVVFSKLNSQFDKSEKFDYNRLIAEKGDDLRKGLKDLKFDEEEIQNTPPYNEMVEDLFVQVKEDHESAQTDGELLAKLIKDHRNKIDDILSKQTIKLDDLLNQKAQLISSDDIHTGFDRSFLNKDKEEEVKSEEKPKGTEKQTVVETINNPTQPVTQSTSAVQEYDDLVLLPATEEFSKISSKSITDSAEFLFKHTNICSEAQKDALIMTAFDSQLEGNSTRAKQIIHQSLLLQYVAQLAGPKPSKDQTIKAIKLFCSKISDSGSPASAGFNQDVENTFNHIKTRCEYLKNEQQVGSQNEEEMIQLKALDEGTELIVNLPAEGTPEYEIFSTSLPKDLQEAVKTESIDEVNKIFATLKVEEAEKILEVFNQCGVIGINGYFEDESEFKELQQQYNENLEIQDSKAQEEQHFNTVDEVD
ncbi:uncharacterized protein CANTADRAFT_54365 [Suhomyces tanzawaensis NRRL Y-17324]|uniref:Hsp90 chaperone protein kinase-targeting subunit n=1 Tax=Suhomyces tanzawaensis NRRL Y-17324 TaxID=984487 RepID=A0A1E4SF57_9ASCO|nr:uncharacterized protein CANTADRAFT_54365 [Suhomyces tanzawaensis NRRL Y-17324]ODV78123.1 hypothetical protein CANTADRAFT_54365 [Suhomyces tanzawaensis NRRL Y-17324]